MPSNFQMSPIRRDPEWQAVFDRVMKVTAVQSDNRNEERMHPEVMRRRVESHRQLMAGLSRLKDECAA